MPAFLKPQEIFEVFQWLAMSPEQRDGESLPQVSATFPVQPTTQAMTQTVTTQNATLKPPPPVKRGTTMVRVTMEILPHGSEENKRTMGIIEIENDGTGDEHFGNYVGRASHAGPYFGKKSGWWLHGIVRGHNRKGCPYWLLSLMLKAMGQG